MHNTEIEQDVKPAFTSDGQARSNLMTREEFLSQVLYSGQITRIAQHLALVLFLVANGKNQLNMSVRDLQKITGWSRKAIKEHLDELDIFMRVTFGGGRAKALIELQGVIEDVIAGRIVAAVPEFAATKVATTDEDVVATNDATTDFVARKVATNVVAPQGASREFVAPSVATNGFVAAHVAASILATVGAASPVMATELATMPQVVVTKLATNDVVASLPPTTWEIPPIQCAERESIYTFNNNSLSPAPIAKETATEEEPESLDELIQLSEAGICGPNFKISYAAVDEASYLAAMPKELGRSIAKICALDWAANGEKPRSPMAMIRKAIKNHANEEQVQEVKLEKAKKPAFSQESREARLHRLLGEEGRS